MRNLEELTIKISKAMPIIIDVEKDYLYKLGFEKAREETKKVEAKFRAAAKKAKVEAERKAKAEVEKVRAEAEKAKTEVEKIRAEAEKAEKKVSIQKMKATNRFSDEEIIEYLSLDEKVFKQYLREIKEEKLSKTPFPSQK